MTAERGYFPWVKNFLKLKKQRNNDYIFWASRLKNEDFVCHIMNRTMSLNAVLPGFPVMAPAG